MSENRHSADCVDRKLQKTSILLIFRVELQRFINNPSTENATILIIDSVFKLFFKQKYQNINGCLFLNENICCFSLSFMIGT